MKHRRHPGGLSHKQSAERHARGRLFERYGINVSDTEWKDFTLRNRKHVVPLEFMDDGCELRIARLGTKYVFYIYMRGQTMVKTFLSIDQVAHTYPHVCKTPEWKLAMDQLNGSTSM